MKSNLVRSESRGHADHGWLKTFHTYSFAGYYDPGRIHFGALRVVNQDKISPGAGFGMHPHDNMEIVTIPLSGSLMHKDSMGNGSVISAGEVQVMSAGTGIMHSEVNPSEDTEVHLLQIWVYPSVKNVAPRYDQMRYSRGKAVDGFLTVVSPDQNDDAMWLHQKTWFTLGYAGESKTGLLYRMHDASNGIFLFVLKGEISAADLSLRTYDAAELSGRSEWPLSCGPGAECLVIEVPLSGF